MFLVCFGVAAGLAVVFVPAFAGGAVEVVGTVSPASIANLLLILVWAATEELVFRGALLRVLRSRLLTALSVALSAAAFMFAHLGSAASAITALVLFLDGIGFALVTLRSRSLVAATVWHTFKNASVWSFGAATFQLTPGLFRLKAGGSDALYLLVTAATVIAAGYLAAAMARSSSPLVTDGAQ